MIFKYGFFIIIATYHVSVSAEDQPLLPIASKSKIYTYCRQPYVEWPCQERWECAKPFCASCSFCLGGREVATLGHALTSDGSCLEVHNAAWCTRDMWFPCRCATACDTFCSIVGNGITVSSAVTALVTCCIFAPLFTDKRCILCPVKKNHTLLNQSSDDQRFF